MAHKEVAMGKFAKIMDGLQWQSIEEAFKESRKG